MQSHAIPDLPGECASSCPPHHWQVVAADPPEREYWECVWCQEVRLPHQYHAEQFSPPAKWATFTDEDIACLGGPEDGIED